MNFNLIISDIIHYFENERTVDIPFESLSKINYDFLPKIYSKEDMVLYRVINLDSDFLQSSISKNNFSEDQFSYNPKPSIGRMNLDTIPVFYASDNPEGSILEMKDVNDPQNKKNHYYLSCWKYDGYESKSICLSNSLKEYDFNFEKILRELIISDSYKNMLIQMLSFMIPLMKNSGFPMLESMVDKYKPDYTFTSFIADQILYKQKCADSIIYQSAIMKKEFKSNYVNHAISTNVADKHLKLMDIFLIKNIILGPNNINKIEILEKGRKKGKKISFYPTDKKQLIHHNSNYIYKNLNVSIEFLR